MKVRTDDGEKVFLNVCLSDKVPPPEDINESELLETLCEDPLEYSIPMSIGAKRLEPDKHGTPCSTFDVVLNTVYFKKCQEKSKFMLFTLSAIAFGISNKFNMKIEIGNCVILKNRKVMGRIQEQRIENREPAGKVGIKKPLIEEMRSTVSNTDDKDDKRNYGGQRSKFDYVILREERRDVSPRLIAIFYILPGTTGKDITVLIGADRIMVHAEKIGLAHDLLLPHALGAKNATCFLDKEMGILRINMPVTQMED